MPVVWGCYTALEIISLVNLFTIRSFPDSEWFKVNVALLPATPTQLQLKDGVFPTSKFRDFIIQKKRTKA